MDTLEIIKKLTKKAQINNVDEEEYGRAVSARGRL